MREGVSLRKKIENFRAAHSRRLGQDKRNAQLHQLRLRAHGHYRLPSPKRLRNVGLHGRWLFEGQTITVSGERQMIVVPGETLKSQTCIVPSSFSRTEIIPPLPLDPLNSAIRSQPLERRSAGPSIPMVGLFCFAFISTPSIRRCPLGLLQSRRRSRDEARRGWCPAAAHGGTPRGGSRSQWVFRL
jgi:hypothetical protein